MDKRESEYQKQLVQVVDEERKRLSHSLHDELGQNLSALGFLVESIRMKMSAHGGQQTLEQLDEIDRLLQTLQYQTNVNARMLNPVELENGGFFSSLEALATYTTKIYKIQCLVTIDRKFKIRNQNIARNIFYIIRESVNNSVKHGFPANIEIKFAFAEGCLEILILDDGRGMKKIEGNETMGLSIMKYRADIIHAKLIVGNRVPKGFEVSLRLNFPF